MGLIFSIPQPNGLLDVGYVFYRKSHGGVNLFKDHQPLINSFNWLGGFEFVGYSYRFQLSTR